MRDQELIKSLSMRLAGFSGKLVGILTHSGGDPDSIGASYTLSNILKAVWSARTLFKIPSEASSHNRSLLERLDFEESDEVDKADVFIVVDSGSPEQLDEFYRILEGGREVIVIDHHSTSLESFKNMATVFCSENYQSVCEIIFDLAEFLRYELSLSEAEALFAGIYYDTVRLSIADEETMKKVCALSSLGINPRELLSGLEIKMDISERIARLKSASRMSVYRIKDWLIAVSRLGSFQSSSARSLVTLGAHVAIVAGESDDGITVSFRSIRDFADATGVNLARDVAARIGAEMGGHGGGHSSAAKAYCNEKDVEKVLLRCVELLSEKLGAPAELIKP